MRTTWAAAALAATAIIGLAGCSDDSSGEPPPAPTAGGDPRAALEQAVRTYVAALYKPDADAGWAYVSQRCREHYGRQAFDDDVERRHSTYGTLGIKTLTIDELSGDTARISYDVGVQPLAISRIQWRLIDGTWRWDNC